VIYLDNVGADGGVPRRGRNGGARAGELDRDGDLPVVLGERGWAWEHQREVRKLVGCLDWGTMDAGVELHGELEFGSAMAGASNVLSGRRRRLGGGSRGRKKEREGDRSISVI